MSRALTIALVGAWLCVAVPDGVVDAAWICVKATTVDGLGFEVTYEDCEWIPDNDPDSKPGGQPQPVARGQGRSDCSSLPATVAANLSGAEGVGNFRTRNGVVEMQWVRKCPGIRDQYYWAPFFGTPGDPATGAPPVITAADIVPNLYDSVERELPAPRPVIAPADRNPGGYVFVNYHAYFWVEEWAPIVETASVPGLSLTMTAQPARVIVDPGDGGSLVCEGAPPALGADDQPSQFRGGCGYVYRNSSSTAPNGETFPVTVTIEWDISWTASTGESGGLGSLSTTSAPRDLPVAEIQAVITG